MKKNLQARLSSLPKRKLPLLADLKLRFQLQVMLFNKHHASLFHLKVWKMVTVSVVLLLVFTSSIGAYAYTSDQVTLGNPLYPIKYRIEKLELSLARASSTQTDLHVKLAERRLNEAKNLAKNKFFNPTNNNNLQTTLNNLRQEVVAVDQDNNRPVKITERYLPDLAGLAEEIPIDEQHLNIIENIARTADYIKHRDQAAVINDYRLEAAVTAATTTPAPKINKDRQTKLKSSEKQTKQNLTNKIKVLRQRVTEMQKQNDKSASTQKNKAEKLISELNRQVENAEISARNNNFHEANNLTRNTELIIDNANLFIVPRATTPKRTSQPESTERTENKTPETTRSDDEQSRESKSDDTDARNTESERTSDSH